ncbi:MAG: type II toxin-antitoxin system VapC family toxin [Tepidisphaeraceae bacterium]|jgi:predicted nucleic acid-binding protein
MIVADTNLIAYLLIGGPNTPLAEAVLRREKVWVAPPLWWHEFLNVVATTVRQNLLSEDRALVVLAEAPLFVRSYDHERPWDVLRLSVETRLATYDCEFAVLARRLMVRLVTADKALLNAVPDVAISMEDFVSAKQ